MVCIIIFAIFFSGLLFPFFSYGSYISLIMTEGYNPRSVCSGLVANSC